MSNVLLEPGAVTCQGLVSIEGPMPDGSCCRDGEEGTRRGCSGSLLPGGGGLAGPDAGFG